MSCCKKEGVANSGQAAMKRKDCRNFSSAVSELRAKCQVNFGYYLKYSTYLFVVGKCQAGY